MASLSFDPEGDTAHAMAFRMAGYIKDPRYIASYVAREYGEKRAPGLKTVEKLMVEKRRRMATRPTATERELKAQEERIAQREADRLKREAQRAADAAKRAERQSCDLAAFVRGLALHESKPARIIAATAYAFSITPETLVGKSRLKRHCLARKTAIRLLRDRQIKVGVLSLCTIGAMIGGRDHSTVKHSLDTFDMEMRLHPEVRDVYTRLKGLVE